MCRKRGYMNFQLINVGIADLKTAKAPDVLRTILGSCVGICMFDSSNKVIGLSHIMLAEKNTAEGNPMKYANTAIPMLLDEMIKTGAVRDKITAKIIGGSTMFKMADNSMMSEIGRSNIRKVKEVLEALSIVITAEDTGGDFGRTIDFFSENGNVKIKSIGKPEKII